MPIDLRQFFQTTNPSRTLDVKNQEDQKYYIDFSTVRGGKIIEELRDNITFFSPDEPTCELFTGHIGCGKSTELRRLEAELEAEGFYVVYFESSQDLEMGDVDVSDILLAIARRVTESLEQLPDIHIAEPKGFKSLLQGAAKLLQTELELSAEANLPGIGTIAADSEGKFRAEVGLPGVGQVTASSQEGISLVALGIGKITAKTKNSPEMRTKLREYLGPRAANIIEIINEELLKPAIAKLKTHGKKGLVVIVDNLDRIEDTIKPWGRKQPEYLFVDRGEQLKQLHCHLIYTIPLSLLFSNDLNRLTSRFGVDPKVLPMVPIHSQEYGQEGMILLKKMVLARAFPDVAPAKHLDLILEVFESHETFDYLCQMSGGHIRGLLQLLNEWIKKERKIPLSQPVLDQVITQRRNQIQLAIDDQEWELLRQVDQRKKVSGDQNYQVMIRSMFVYEYRDSSGSWFEVNPLLKDAPEFTRA